MTNAQVGVIIDAAQASDIYLKATGETPPPIPDWSGPLYSPIEADGNAAILIRRHGDNGMDISAIVALGAPDIDAGFSAIERALTAITGENKWHRVGDDSGGTFASVASAICKRRASR